jgi:hypothetical protein
MIKDIAKKLVAAGVAAGAALVAIVALGFTIFYALDLVWPPLGAAAATFGLFALIAGLTAAVFLGGAAHKKPEEEDVEPEGLASRAIHLVKQRPVIGVVGGLAAALLLLRNPALAAIAASMITEKRAEKRYRRRIW